MQSKPKTDLEQALIACKGSFLTVGFFSLFINLLLLVPSFYMLQVYDRVLSSSSITTLVMLTLIMLLLMATYGALEWIRSRILVRVSTRLDLLLNERLYDASFKQALYTGGAQASAQPLNDLTGLRQFLTGQGLFAFFDAPWLPIYIAVMYFFHPLFGALTVLGAILLILLAYANEKLTGKRLAEANQENARATQFTSKNLRNAEVVASMGMMPSLFKQWRKRNTHVLGLQARASEHGGALSNLSKTLRMVLQSLILGLGAWLVIDHQITPGLMTAGSLLLGRALAPIDLMIGSWKGFISARGQYARLNDMMRQVQAEPPRMSLPAPKGNISVEQLILTPPGAFQPILKGISFNVTAVPRSAFSAPAPRASRPWRARCWASGRRKAARCAWTAPTSPNGSVRNSVRTLATCRRTSSCSMAASATTSPALARWMPRPWSRPLNWPGCMT